MKKDFVVFHSPGTFFTETSERAISGWNIKEALELARGIKERYNASPFGFVFETRAVAGRVTVDGVELDVVPKTLKKSGMHYIMGRVLTLADIPDDDEHHILRSNMEINDMKAVCETRNSWRHTGPFDKKDVCVDWDGNITARGSDYQ